MLRLRTVLALGAFALAALSSAMPAAALTVVNVGAPAVNCVFAVNCINMVTDSVGNFTPPGDTGTARLQSRTTPGIAPAPLAGKLDYVYRVDMTSVTAGTPANCVTRLQVLFGPVTQGPYPPGPLRDVYVVTAGGLGSVGIASASQTGGMVTFNFDGAGVCPGQTSYFFGLASSVTTPVTGMARVYFSLGGATMTPARIP